ncbi:MAG: hypothetical protein XD44_0574 [Methanobacteriaceae archaeon 41_258]|nr:MAG: hypothetical protein XD44_0574 [Methanobacteriaceae archaeon 41_258]
MLRKMYLSTSIVLYMHLDIVGNELPPPDMRGGSKKIVRGRIT